MAMDGSSLGRFTLLEKIGEGGMGRVYKARDTRLERLVAVKVLPEARLADPADAHASFRRPRPLRHTNDGHSFRSASPAGRRAL